MTRQVEVVQLGWSATACAATTLGEGDSIDSSRAVRSMNHSARFRYCSTVAGARVAGAPGEGAARFVSPSVMLLPLGAEFACCVRISVE